MTVIELIDKNAELAPEETALCDMETEFTFKQVKEKSEQAAACFQALGIAKGDVVAIMSQNTFDFVSELPHTPSGKVMKYKLREDYSNV